MSTKNKSQLQQELQQLEAQKEELLSKKKSSPKEWTKEQQSKLDEIVESVVDVEEQIELAETTEKPVETSKKAVSESKVKTYKPAPGTENLVHLSIVRGRRFNPDSGKEESTPYVQMFTLSEYNAFMKNAELLGYTVISELYNPYKK